MAEVMNPDGALVQVGHDGIGGWVHTDGETYSYDPATCTHKPADELAVGDVIAYPGRPDAEVLRTAEPYTDLFGRALNAHWCRRLDTGAEGQMPYGPGGKFPVRLTRGNG